MASLGLMSVALRAGIHAAAMATQPENTTPQTASHQGSTHRSSCDAKITGISHFAIKLSIRPAARSSVY